MSEANRQCGSQPDAKQTQAEKQYRVSVEGDYVVFDRVSHAYFTHSLHAAVREFNRYCTPYYDHVTLEQDGPRGYETTLQTWCPSMFEGVQA